MRRFSLKHSVLWVKAVVVSSLSPELHPEFARAREEFKSHPAAANVLFHAQSGGYQRRPLPADSEEAEASERAERHARDVGEAVLAALAIAGRPPPEHVMLLEDDQEACQNALEGVFYAIRKAARYCPQCRALR
eukprot:tig00020703_g13105.t1